MALMTANVSSHAQTDLEVARRIIAEHLDASGATVYLFGSRARGDARRWSDIDVAVQSPKALPVGTLSALREALENSNMLLDVDLVDWQQATAELRASILREGIRWTD
jgi:predicted nucleotidyltransferase